MDNQKDVIIIWRITFLSSFSRAYFVCEIDFCYPEVKK